MRKTLSKKKRTKIKSSSYKGFILYEGASVLDGQDIVAIVTMNTRNTKTGDMPQVWILVKDVDPLSASKQGLDVSVCGNCPQRLKKMKIAKKIWKNQGIRIKTR